MLHRTNIYIEETDMAFLKTLAEEHDTTMSDIVRSLIREKIKQTTRKKSAKESLKSIAAIGKSLPKSIQNKLPKDLSENHDYYLYGEPYEKKKKTVR